MKNPLSGSLRSRDAKPQTAKSSGLRYIYSFFIEHGTVRQLEALPENGCIYNISAARNRVS